MRVVEVRNVSEAWARLPGVLHDAEEQDSRSGRVLVCPEPVTTVYLRPTERVLRDERRDANPFFHLVEALWMLAGRDDAETLDYYVRDFGARFGDGPQLARYIHGAYGRRWRRALGYDQLNVIVEKLRLNPWDRQAVLQMWDGANTPDFTGQPYGHDDLRGDWKDRPCNTHAYLRVRGKELDLTVCCRSNDMVFGGYGANAVHFSVLQEYLAARLGLSVGTYTQVSNNFHVYRDVWDARRPVGDDVFEHQEWGPRTLRCEPMFSVPELVDADLEVFFRWHESLWVAGRARVKGDPEYANDWFLTTAAEVAYTYRLHRWKQPRAALSHARAINCPAWRAACVEWLQRRGAR